MNHDDDRRSARWDEGLKTAGPSGEDHPQANREPHGGQLGGSPPGMTHDDVNLRSEISAYLDRTVFPAGREKLIHAAQSKEAPDQIVGLLNKLPSDVTFQDVGEVWRGLSGSGQPPSS